MSVFYAVFCGGGTQHHPLSAAIAKNRVKNAHGGPKRRLRMAHLVSKPFVIVNDPYTHATSPQQVRLQWVLAGNGSSAVFGQSVALDQCSLHPAQLSLGAHRQATVSSAAVIGAAAHAGAGRFLRSPLAAVAPPVHRAVQVDSLMPPSCHAGRILLPAPPNAAAHSSMITVADPL